MWQEVDGRWHSCHWWRNIDGHQHRAMEILVALAATVPVLVVVALVLVLLHLVRGDGLGHRRPPASRAEWTADRLPSRPYREG